MPGSESLLQDRRSSVHVCLWSVCVHLCVKKNVSVWLQMKESLIAKVCVRLWY